MCLLVDDVPVMANLVGLPAVAVLVVVPVDDCGDPLTGLLFACKWLER